eukprot:GHVS01067691.1.p1 GENE.GHVS01067691.1~~GHVS01067691.1.p1  ORF type:complete len:146 (+),score=11.27 GHVS01067691.1:118-555(+)
MTGNKLFCCDKMTPYKCRRTDHEDKFKAFLAWEQGSSAPSLPAGFGIQFCQNTNFQKDHRVSFYTTDNGTQFNQDEGAVSSARSLNSFKNFKCAEHNQFFEVNLYSTDGMAAVSNRVESTRKGNEFQRTEVFDLGHGVENVRRGG